VVIYDLVAKKIIMHSFRARESPADLYPKIFISGDGTGCVKYFKRSNLTLETIYPFSCREINPGIDVRAVFGMEVKNFKVVNDHYFALGRKKSSPPIIFILNFDGSIIWQIEIPEFVDCNLCRPVFNEDYYILVGLNRNSEGKMEAKAFVLDLQTGQQKIYILETSDSIRMERPQAIHRNTFFYICSYVKEDPSIRKITELDLMTGEHKKEYIVSSYCDFTSLVANDDFIIYSRMSNKMNILHRRDSLRNFSITNPNGDSSSKKLNFVFFERYVHICCRSSKVLIILDLTERKIVKQTAFYEWITLFLESNDLVIVNHRNKQIIVRDYVRPLFEGDDQNVFLPDPID